MSRIAESELILNPDGSIFHLHLKPQELANTIILVGDPMRSDLIASKFDTIEIRKANREFVSNTGLLNGHRLSVVSTGIGCDNIDIVLNELDALVNIDFQTREVKSDLIGLRIVRLGTSGAVCSNMNVGDYVMSEWSLGCDGLLNFYGGMENVVDQEMESEFIKQTGWNPRLARPYFVKNNAELVALFEDFAIKGLTASAPGFYAPQGRVLRLPLAQKDFMNRVQEFEHRGMWVTNFEMEASAIAGLSAMMGHKALTICAIIAQRNKGNGKPDYAQIMQTLIEKALEKLTK